MLAKISKVKSLINLWGALISSF